MCSWWGHTSGYNEHIYTLKTINIIQYYNSFNFIYHENIKHWNEDINNIHFGNKILKIKSYINSSGQ